MSSAAIRVRATRRRVTTNEDDKRMEKNFIILLTRVEQVSPSMAQRLKYRDTMPMRPVVSTPLHLSIRRAVNYFRGKKKRWRRKAGRFSLKTRPPRQIHLSNATCREMISRGYIVSRGSFFRVNEVLSRSQNIKYRPISRSRISRERDRIFGDLSDDRQSSPLSPIDLLSTFFFSEHACTRARARVTYLPRDCPNFFIVAFYSAFYREFTFRRSLMDSRGAALTLVSILTESPIANRTRRIFSS